MTKIQHDALIKFNQVSQQREMCCEKEKKVKRNRNIAIIVFLISVAFIVAYELAVHSAIFKSINIDAFTEAIPGKEFTFLFLGIISFVFLLVSVFKSISVEMKAESARKEEGKLAERAFALMLLKTERN
ncbi:MAG: hypothetical protein HQ541_13725 [Mariniphaga sp.]|nr:hypothetical protein [Mariniphaga sp.]